MSQVEYYDQLDRINFIYPYYESPFTVMINENYSHWLINYCNKWIIDNCGILKKDKKFIDTLYNSDLSFYSACCYPTANFHRLEKLIKWCTIFFIIDDYHDNLLNYNQQINYDNFWQQMIEMYDGILNDYQCNEWPILIKAIQLLMKEIYFDFNDEQIKRSINMFKDYIQGNLLENELSKKENDNEKKFIPNWNDYMKARLGSIGGQMTIQLIEYAKNITLTDDEWNYPLMKLLIKAVFEEMILINDHYTFRKEIAESNFKFSKMHHAYTVLIHTKGFTLQEAVDYVHQLICEKDLLILKLIDQITNDNKLKSNNNNNRIKLFIDGVKEVLGGYWRYAIQSRRYHGENYGINNNTIPLSGQFFYDQHQTIIINDNNNNQNYKLLKISISENVQPK